MKAAAIAASFTLLATACGGGDTQSEGVTSPTVNGQTPTSQTPTSQTPTSQTPTTERPDPGPGVLYVPDCKDGADCAAGFMLDGVFYQVDCTAIRDELVSTEALGAGDFAGFDATVNAIEGVSENDLVALSLPGGTCKEGDLPTTGWSAAYTGGRSRFDNSILCQVALLTDDQLIANGCENG